MNSDKFPYDEDEFSNDDNKKLARMIEWEYKNLCKNIKKNKEEINGHEVRVGDLEEEMLELQVKNSYYKNIRNYVLEIIGASGGLGIFLLALFNYLF